MVPFRIAGQVESRKFRKTEVLCEVCPSWTNWTTACSISHNVTIAQTSAQLTIAPLCARVSPARNTCRHCLGITLRKIYFQIRTQNGKIGALTPLALSRIPSARALPRACGRHCLRTAWQEMPARSARDFSSLGIWDLSCRTVRRVDFLQHK